MVLFNALDQKREDVLVSWGEVKIHKTLGKNNWNITIYKSITEVAAEESDLENRALLGQGAESGL